MITRRFAVILGIAALTLSACATAPSKIRPAFVDPAVYAQPTCAELSAEAARLAVVLSESSRRQRRARQVDQLGVFLIGLPIARMAGMNEAEQIAQLKGAQIALAEAMATRPCPPAP